MLIVEDVSGQQEPLLVTEVHVTEQLNTVEQLDFVTANTPDNLTAYKMLQPRTLVTEPNTGQIYRLSNNEGSALGNYFQRTLTALQVIQDLDGHLVRTKLTGIQTLDNAMKFITAGTNFTYTIHDSGLSSYDFGEDGIGEEKALGMFLDSIVTNYQIEFKANGYNIDIYKELGQHDSFVFIGGDDVYNLADSGDYTQLYTHVYGVGKAPENANSDDTTEQPPITAEYTSPNASVYGVIDDELFEDDNATTPDQLIAEMKAKLIDVPKVQYTASFNKFEKNNPVGRLNDTSLGNYGYIADRASGIDIESRIVQRDIYPQSQQEDTLTFGNKMLDPNRMLAELRSNHNSNVQNIREIVAQETSHFSSSSDIQQMINNAIAAQQTPSDIKTLFNALVSSKSYTVAPNLTDLVSNYGNNIKLADLNNFTFFKDLLTTNLGTSFISGFDTSHMVKIYVTYNGQTLNSSEFSNLIANGYRSLTLVLNADSYSKNITINVGG